MSGYCTFCHVWHSGSCCYPARPIPPQVFTTCSTPEINTDYTALQQRHDALVAERDALRAEVDGLRKDAERYRKYRELVFGPHWPDSLSSAENADEMDTAIDAALSKEPTP